MNRIDKKIWESINESGNIIDNWDSITSDSITLYMKNGIGLEYAVKCKIEDIKIND